MTQSNLHITSFLSNHAISFSAIMSMAPKIHTNLYNTNSVVALIARIIMKSHEPKLPGQSHWNCHWVSPWPSLYCPSFSASCMPVQTPCACGRA